MQKISLLPATSPAKAGLFAFLFLLSFPAIAQKWGYITLIAKMNTNSIQLIDTNNVAVKQWNSLSGNTGYSCYMTKGGDLWRTVVATGNSFMGGGMCGRIQKISWNGSLLFDYIVSDANQCSHHDIKPLPNGNVLLIIYERKTAAQVQAAGATVNQERWTEKIIELKPTGLNTATIVWQWNLWDHLVQNLYPAKANYQTSILDHPELLNINYNNTRKDWVHMNGIDYNAALDQIVVSSHYLNELWVIDHSTTTAQAASHSGGNSGKGGDFLYRWGNPAAYSASGPTIFNVVHDAHWVSEDCPRAGWLGGFNNNGVSNLISAADLFQPPWDGTKYTHTAGQAYQPSTYGYRHQANGYSSNMSSCQQLPNGNMLICLATTGKVYEINANGTQIGQYTSPSSFIPKAWRYSRCYLENPKIAVNTPDPNICSGGSAGLSITPTATNVNSFTYAWAPTTGLSSTTIANPMATGLTDTTIYTVTISTPGGCTTTATVSVNVWPPPVANAGSDVTLPNGQSAELVATGGETYQWSTGEQNDSITVSPAVTTTYTVTVADANGCTATDEVTVNISAPISLNATASISEFCLGGSTQLSVAASGGTGIFNYQWSSQPAGFSSSESDPVVAPTENTVYTILVTDNIGNAMSGMVNVTIFPLPNANAGNDVNILIGATADLSATGGVSYVWNTGDSTASISVAPTQTTTYTVVVTDANGCSSSDMVTVIVDTTLPLEGSISATDTMICIGEVLQLFGSALNGNGSYAYSWTSIPAGFSSTLPDPFVNPAETTLYQLIISDGSESVMLSLEIEVNPLEPQPAITISGDSLISSSPTNNQWYYYGNPIVLATGQVFHPSLDGAYQVQVLGANGCHSPLSEPFEFIAVIPLEGNVTASKTEICIGEVLQLLASAIHGLGNYTYSWSSIPVGFSSSLPDPFVNPEETTIYTVEISDGTSTIALSLEIVVNPLEAQPSITVSGNSLISSSPVNNQWFFYGNPIDQATGQVFNPAFDGSYQVQVIGENGCPSPLSDPYEYFAPLPLEGYIYASDTSICVGEVLLLIALGEQGSGNYSYSWTSVPAGFVSNLASPFVNPEETTLYTVEISDGLNSIIMNIEIVVNPLAPQPSITVSGDSLISSSPVNNQWFFYGSPIDQATGQVFNPSFDGSYQVQVIDVNGCPSPLSEPYEYFVLSNTQPLSGKKWWIAPNPAVSELNIMGDFDDQAFFVEIMSSTGRLIKREHNNRALSVTDLPAGVYMLRLNTAEGVGVQKVVVLR
ncbi:MAG: aryl-sulfate sulfotransferase [Saprospiraceae bacterium]